MLGVAGPDDGRVAMRMSYRVTQDQFRPTHVRGQNFVELRPRPNVVYRRALNLGVRPALGYAAAQNNPRSRLCRLCDHVAVLRGEARIGDLKRIEDVQS